MTGGIGVIGGGAWGCALAQIAAGGPVRLWARDAATVATIRATGSAPRLPGIALSPRIVATADLNDLDDCDLLLVVVPAAATASILAGLANQRPRPLILCAKGFGPGGEALADVAAAALPGWSVALLSGPTFATEVAAGLPAAATLACADGALAEALAARLSGRAFRLYATTDVIGVGLGGAVKNVLAIACGVVAGRGLGDNARAATVTRGFAEMRRYGRALGAAEATLGGLSGLGDLVLTCGGPASRNFAFGAALGAGVSRPTTAFVIPANAGTHLRMHQVMGPRVRGDDTVDVTVEGALAAPILAAAAAARDIDLPIATAVADLIAGRVTVDAAIERLLARPLRSEQA